MIYISVIIAFLYILIIIAFIVGFDNLKSFKKNNKTTPEIKFSIIIPFRNEAENLSSLLTSIYNLNYPSDFFEVFLIDDHSSDNSLEVINSFTTKTGTVSIRILRGKKQSNSPKKDAIELGLKYASFDWIVTTDADCVVPNNWLQLFNQQIEEKQPVFISAPVKFKKQNSFLFHFQNLNFISLIGSTIGSFGIEKPIMCNGANLCYNKTAFNEVNGFEGNLKIASGDDVFLLEKMRGAFPSKVSFLKSKEAIVETNSEKNLNSFINQQIRWASKSTAYKNSFAKFVGITVLAMNLLLVVLLIASIIHPILWKYLLTLFVLKLIFDWILISKTASFLNDKKSLKYILFTSVLYPFFIVGVGILSIFKSFEWKGRKYNM